MKYNNKLN